MRIVGHGIDIMDVADARRLADQPDGHFLRRCFTDNEISDAGSGVNRAERLAGRFAAKEAVAKAMGVGAGDGFGWTDIEIKTAETGAPSVVLQGGAAARAADLGITAWSVSTSHTATYAVASAIALGSVGRRKTRL
jgi:holo-[acyl-carrier protein] synthase